MNSTFGRREGAPSTMPMPFAVRAVVAATDPMNARRVSLCGIRACYISYATLGQGHEICSAGPALRPRGGRRRPTQVRRPGRARPDDPHAHDLRTLRCAHGNRHVLLQGTPSAAATI